LVGDRDATAFNQRPVQSIARCRFTQLATQFGIAQQAGDHGDVGVMAIRHFPGYEHSENQVDGLAVVRIEIYRFGQLYHRGNTPVDSLDTTVRESDTGLQAGTAEPLALDQTFEYIVSGYIGLRPNQQFTQDFQTVFLAARVRIAEHCVGVDDFFEQHGLLLLL
jgi:hypothetical protein